MTLPVAYAMPGDASMAAEAHGKLMPEADDISSLMTAPHHTGSLEAFRSGLTDSAHGMPLAGALQCVIATAVPALPRCGFCALNFHLAADAYSRVL
jgi:hypothetical protein